MKSFESTCSRRAFLALAAGLSVPSWALRAMGAVNAAAPGAMEAQEPAATNAGAAENADAASARPACKPLRRAIPKTGETLAAVGLGTWQGLNRAHLEDSKAVLARFVELGGELVDTAPMYADAESAIGDIVGALDLRERLFLATKVMSTGREAGREQMRKSFEYLGITRLDLMQVHNLVDWRTQLETLRELRVAGTVRYAGVTHYLAGAHAQLEGIVKDEDVDFVQVNYNIGVRDAEKRLLPLAADRGVAVIINRPYEEGELFGRVRGATLPAWAAEIGCASFGQIFLKYILSHPAVTCVIPGTDKVAHVEDNMGAGCGAMPDAGQRKRMTDWFDAL